MRARTRTAQVRRAWRRRGRAGRAFIPALSPARPPTRALASAPIDTPAAPQPLTRPCGAAGVLGPRRQGGSDSERAVGAVGALSRPQVMMMVVAVVVG
jgi:hypothetical protein